MSRVKKDVKYGKLGRQSFFKRNGSTILTLFAAAGFIVTVVMTAKETPKAMQLLEKKKEELDTTELTVKEKIVTAAPVYAKTAIIGASSLLCLFGATMLSRHTQASLASACGFIGSSFDKYRTKVKELYGDQAHEAVLEKMASEPANVINARYELNRKFTSSGYATMNDFFDCLRLPHIPEGEQLGWDEAYTLGWDVDNFDVNGYGDY